MMKENPYVPCENLQLLMEIFDLRMHLEELYSQKGSENSDYISLSIRLNVLMKKYFEEKMAAMMNSSKDEMKKLWENSGYKSFESLEICRKLEELGNKYHKLQKII